MKCLSDIIDKYGKDTLDDNGNYTDEYVEWLTKQILELLESKHSLQQVIEPQFVTCKYDHVKGNGLTKDKKYEIIDVYKDRYCIKDDNEEIETYHKNFFNI